MSEVKPKAAMKTQEELDQEIAEALQAEQYQQPEGADGKMEDEKDYDQPVAPEYESGVLIDSPSNPSHISYPPLPMPIHPPNPVQEEGAEAEAAIMKQVMEESLQEFEKVSSLFTNSPIERTRTRTMERSWRG